jgi:stage II sporulation protein D
MSAPAPSGAGERLKVGMRRPGGGYRVVTLPIEIYVPRVLAGEAAPDSAPAALEALAIAIRTFALANRGRHRPDGFDLCDQTHCQVLRAATEATERAGRATAGRVLTRNGVAASIFYTASCGGRTEVPSAVWPGADDPSFLPSRDDDACGGAPKWTAAIDAADLTRALRATGFRGDRLHDLRVLSRHRSGRVARLRVEGLRPEHISGQDLRMAVGRTLGWQYIKSTAFDLRRQSSIFQFSGHGFGHGVGLCVIGSTRLAQQGKSATAILRRYFPGLDVSTPVSAYEPPAFTPLPGGPRAGGPPAGASLRSPNDTDVLVSLPDEDEGERDAIARLTSRARDDIARALGVPPPPRLTLRFHPTTADYERVTGQAWFTSGSLVNGDLHLLPLAVLRGRDVLDRTIRHELVHVMTGSALAKRPAWVREGAASYFAGVLSIPGEPADRPPSWPEVRRACPRDDELWRPVSIGALSNAYARARACFARQIAAGRKWTEVK